MLALLATACASTGPQIAETSVRTSSVPGPVMREEVVTQRAARPDAESDTEPQPTVLISAPDALASLELGFGATVFEHDARSTLQLRKSRSYRELGRALVTAGAPKWWVRHPNTTFELAAVVNRLDRMDVMPGTCGETRLVYRLVHQTDEGTVQTLPLALNVLYVQPRSGEDCQAVAQSWQASDVQALAESGGPLSASKLTPENLHAIESNLRIDDEESPVNELRVHEHTSDARWDERHWKDGILEFSPGALYKGRGWSRVVEILTEPAMREAIHQGTPTTKEHGRSYPEWDSTDFLGWGSLDSVLPEDADYAPFASKDAFLDRGRSLTCGGCHATRAVEGFHVSREPSTHLQDEVPWRTAYVHAVSEGREPNRQRLSVSGEE